MDDTCFDLLCKDLTADEAKVFRKMVAEWSNGDENGFPVQFALLTRVQWRAAASVPRSVDQSREILERTFSEHRQHIIGFVKSFEEATEAKLQALEKSQTAQARQAGESVETLRSQLAEVRAVAKLMEGDLRTGAVEWHRAHQQFETERRKLDTALGAMNQYWDLQQLVFTGLLLLAACGIGLLIGHFVWR
jgi:hypothetical protein